MSKSTFAGWVNMFLHVGTMWIASTYFLSQFFRFAIERSTKCTVLIVHCRSNPQMAVRSLSMTTLGQKISSCLTSSKIRATRMRRRRRRDELHACALGCVMFIPCAFVSAYGKKRKKHAWIALYSISATMCALFIPRVTQFSSWFQREKHVDTA